MSSFVFFFLDSFVNSQEWTLSRSVPELKVVSNFFLLFLTILVLICPQRFHLTNRFKCQWESMFSPCNTSFAFHMRGNIWEIGWTFSLAHSGWFLMRYVGMAIQGGFAAGHRMSDSFGLGQWHILGPLPPASEAHAQPLPNALLTSSHDLMPSPHKD